MSIRVGNSIFSKNMKIKTVMEFSAGGIVLEYLDKDSKIILIRKKNRKPKKIDKIWCLPKGKIENKETKQQAAIREVREETGIYAKIIKFAGKIEYWFYKNKFIKCNKKVYFYIMQKQSGKINNDSFEVDEVKWFNIDDAILNMSYKSEIEIVKKLKQELKTLSKD